jgi:hypothetical protein
MAETETKERENAEETNGNGNGSNGGGGAGRTAVRAAAIAAVSGATALAAKKAFGGGSSGSDDDKPERKQGSGRNNEVFGSMVSSAWDSAKDTIVPMIENAATTAGEYVARSGPELVRETVVPKFIDGFQRGGSDDD